ncbi:MAG: hypothetical protein IJI21_01490 [Clostridia bacterium]|nr:hypothetical protein [Clostridia bacterium]
MSEAEKKPEESFDPFSLEQAYKTYQQNIRRADELIYEITKGARGDVSEHDLLLMAVEAIARMTDNTAFRMVVERALKDRGL